MKTQSLLILFLFLFKISHSQNIDSVGLIPWPQDLKQNTGILSLNSNSKIIFEIPELEKIAKILKDDIKKRTGLVLEISNGPSQSGDIELSFNDSLKEEEYSLVITDKIVIKAKDYKSTIWAISTLIQALGSDANLQKMEIIDAPDTAYRGLMIDLARNWHTTKDLENIIDLCRLYKINFLQLHLTDDASFTFPSTVYPEMATPSKSYTLQELNDLEKYSQDRGVTIIPELDVPAHASAMIKAYPAIFEIPGKGGIINFSSEEVWGATKTLIDEIAQVFKSSPYIHVGGDEANLSGLESNDDFIRAIDKYDVGDVQGLFNYYINQVNSYVKNNAKKTIIWEGFNPRKRGVAKLDTDITICPFDNHTTANTYAQSGYDILNTSWFPLYLVPSTYVPIEKIYNWNITQFGRYNSPFPFSHTNVFQYEMTNLDKLVGAQTCSWEQSADLEIPSLRDRISTMSERIWNMNSNKNFTNYLNRLESTNDVLQDLLASVLPEPITPAVSFDIFMDKINVQWRASEGFPKKYTLYRNTTNNSATATPILSDTELTSYIDNTAMPDRTYYYWIKAQNSIGFSDFGESSDGRRGSSSLVSMYEPYEYTDGENLNNLNKGVGFDNPWSITKDNGKATVKSDGLTYPNLVTSGGKLNIDMQGGTDSFFATRKLKGVFCPEGSEVWVSVLIQANKVGNGHCFLSVSDQVIGKKWGNGLQFAKQNLQQALVVGETNLVVLRIENFEGKDNIHMWTNPTVGNEPKKTDLGYYFSDRFDIGTKPEIKFDVQFHDEGSYDFDELRIGTTYEDVMPSKVVLSVDDFDFKANRANIYPNPFDNNLQIELEKGHDFTKALLFDINGKLLKEVNLDDNRRIEFLQGLVLPSGIYLLKLQGKQKSQVMKILRK